MSVNCITACLDQLPLGQNYLTECDSTTRKYGYDFLTLVRCDVEFVNILDSTEWETLKAEGKVISFPCGNFKPGEPAEAEFFTYGCGKKKYESPIYPFTYSTPDVSPDCSDEDWFCALNSSKDSFKAVFGKCGTDRMYLPKTQVEAAKAGLAGGGAVPMTNVGFEFSMTTPNFTEVNGDGLDGIWQMSGEFTNSGVLKSVEIDGIASVLA